MDLNFNPKNLADKIKVAPQKAEPLLKTTRDWVLMIGAALYVLSPFDLIPEAIFGIFGLVDDLLVVALAGVYFLSRFNESKNR